MCVIILGPIVLGGKNVVHYACRSALHRSNPPFTNDSLPLSRAAKIFRVCLLGTGGIGQISCNVLQEESEVQEFTGKESGNSSGTPICRGFA